MWLPVDPSDKISPIISAIQASGTLAAGSLPFNGNFMVEFHDDVTADEIRSLILNQGVTLLEHPDLSTNHLLVHFSGADQMAAALVALTADDRIAYIFPASDDLANGISSRAYAAPATVGGPIAQTIPINGNGWDGARAERNDALLFLQPADRQDAGRAATERDPPRDGGMVQGNQADLDARYQRNGPQNSEHSVRKRRARRWLSF